MNPKIFLKRKIRRSEYVMEKSKGRSAYIFNNLFSCAAIQLLLVRYLGLIFALPARRADKRMEREITHTSISSLIPLSTPSLDDIAMSAAGREGARESIFRFLLRRRTTIRIHTSVKIHPITNARANRLRDRRIARRRRVPSLSLK